MLGDIANDRHDVSTASDYWLQAYRLGEHSEDLVVHLQDVGIDDPDQELDDEDAAGRRDAATI